MDRGAVDDVVIPYPVEVLKRAARVHKAEVVDSDAVPLIHFPIVKIFEKITQLTDSQVFVHINYGDSASLHVEDDIDEVRANR